MRLATSSSTPDLSYKNPTEVHQELKSELSTLMRHAYLTPEEQERARLLKKLKLRAKDRMHQPR